MTELFQILTQRVGWHLATLYFKCLKGLAAFTQSPSYFKCLKEGNLQTIFKDTGTVLLLLLLPDGVESVPLAGCLLVG